MCKKGQNLLEIRGIDPKLVPDTKNQKGFWHVLLVFGAGHQKLKGFLDMLRVFGAGHQEDKSKKERGEKYKGKKRNGERKKKKKLG